MHWLQRFFAPQSRPFIIYVTLLVALFAGARWYQGRFKQRTLAQMVASVHDVVADKTELAKLKMERTSLEFQLPTLPRDYPVLTNASLAADWSSSAVLSQLDPEVCKSWRAYLNQVSPLLQAKDPSLGPYLVLQQGYVAEVEPLAEDAFLHNKPSRLMDLRAKKFAPLLRQEPYVADAVRFEHLAQSLADEETLALRKVYEVALTTAATNLNPRLSGYAHARLALLLRSDQLRQRVRQLNEQLGNPDAAPAQPTQLSVITKSPRDLLRLGALETYAPQEKDFVSIIVATALLGFLITQPVEMRDRRWLKISASVALVYLGLLALRVQAVPSTSNSDTKVFAFFGFLVPAALLAAIWASPFTSFLSNLFLQLIAPSGPDETEDSRLRPAYEAARQGQYRLALKLVKPKLLLDPWHYEALVLKARLHRQLNRTWCARWTLAKILRHRHLTPGQREHVQYLRRSLRRKDDACWSLEHHDSPRQDFEELSHF